MSFAQKLSDAVLGLSNKLLTIPVSIGALSLFTGSSDNFNAVNIAIYLISTLVLCITVRLSIDIQQDCLVAIKKSYLSIFEKKNKKIAFENQILADLINDNLEQLDGMFKKLNFKINFYSVLSWFPLLAFSIFCAYKTADTWIPYYRLLLS
ncbi:hypothetical protein D3C78_1194750 [compost metagenome]